MEIGGNVSIATQTEALVSPEKYLERERAATLEKSEYRDGEIVPLSGASFRHFLIVSNIVRVLGNQLVDSPCLMGPNDLRVSVGGGLFTYPDVVVVCGEPQFTDAQQDTLLSPTLLVEVLSPSTENHDRGGKFARYRTLNSLQEYVLVLQEEAHVEHYARQSEDRWLLTEVRGREVHVELPSIGARLDLAELCRNVEELKA